MHYSILVKEWQPSIELVALHGLEPRYAHSECAVLPLDDKAKLGTVWRYRTTVIGDTTRYSTIELTRH